MGLALIVGGSSGIGLALARRFAASGHDVVMVARDKRRLDAAAAAISAETGRSMTPVALDAASLAGRAALVAVLRSQALKPDFVVISLGKWQSGGTSQVDVGLLREAIEQNVIAPLALLQDLLGLVQPRARCLVVGSLAGLLPLPNLSVYASAKAHLHASVLAMRQELRGTGVTLSLLAPGLVKTNFVPAPSGRLLRVLFELMASRPETVARAAFSGLLSRQRLIVPSVPWRLVRFGIAILPPSILDRLAGVLLVSTAAGGTARK